MIHDGSALHLFADGREVLVREAPVEVPGVGPQGVEIGNRPGANESIRGDIDEIKIWRRDPRVMWRDFARRPIDQKTADCWHDFMQRIDEMLRAHPDCEERLLSGVRRVLKRMTRTVGAHGPAARAHAGQFYQRYRVLWRKGQIDGAAMAKLITEWSAWNRSLGVDVSADAEVHALLSDPCFKLMGESSVRIDCDSKFMGYLRLFTPPPRPSAPTTAV
jgi:hypothetical protein